MHQALSVGLCVLLLAGGTTGGTAAAQSPNEKQSEATRAMERGSEAMARGEFEIAISYFRSAKLLLPDASGPRLALGLALRSNLQCREALNELEDYQRLKPEGDNR